MYEELDIILYPDPRLKRASKPIEDFGPSLPTLATRMFELLRQARGVGLAAPQVGLNVRLFIVNHTGKPEDDRIYVNPVLFDAEGEETGNEGCLSIPGITVDVVRAKKVRIEGQDAAGQKVERIAEGYEARIWQHELDHLNGTLLIDRMGPTAQLVHRKTLKELEDQYLEDHPPAKVSPARPAPRRKS